MATKKSTESASSLEAEVAALRKEVAALKKQLASSKSSGGADPRLDKFLEAFRMHSTKWRNILDQAGL